MFFFKNVTSKVLKEEIDLNKNSIHQSRSCHYFRADVNLAVTLYNCAQLDNQAAILFSMQRLDMSSIGVKVKSGNKSVTNLSVFGSMMDSIAFHNDVLSTIVAEIISRKIKASLIHSSWYQTTIVYL